MYTPAAVLIIVSCFLHAAWNLMARSSREEVLFFRRLLIASVPVSVAAAAAGAAFMDSWPPAAFFGCMVGSGLIAGAYFLFLGLSYKTADFTVVYPVARATPVLIVTGIEVLFRDRLLTATGWFAVVIITLGTAVAPQKSLKDFSVRHYGSRTFAWIALTAAAIVGFTMLDKRAAELVQPGLAGALVQTALFHLFATAAFLALHPVLDRSGGDPRLVGWRGPARAMLMEFATYVLVLWAFQMESNTGYLIAFRQFSIVIGVAVAFAIHREKGLSVRLPAALAIVAGIVLIKLFG